MDGSSVGSVILLEISGVDSGSEAWIEGTEVETSCIVLCLVGGVKGIALGRRNALAIEFWTLVCCFDLAGEDL